MEIVQANWQAFLPILIGALLSIGALAKAVDLGFAGAQIARYGIFSEVTSQWAAALLAMTEAGLGVSLVVGLHAHTVATSVMAFLVTLTVVALWFAAGKNIDNCACYGKLLRLSPVQSAFANVAICILLSVWLLKSTGSNNSAGLLPALAVVTSVLLVGAIARHTAFHGALLLFSAFRPGRRWPATVLSDVRLAANAPDPGRDEAIVVLATQTCSVCRSWLQVLNALSLHPGELRVLGVVAKGEIPVEEFRSSLRLNMPLAEIPLETLLGWWSRPPLAVLVRQGVIAECWRNRLPAALIERARLR